MSNMDDRWEEDAKWYKEDAKKHPEKYQRKDDEEEVTTEQIMDYLDFFLKRDLKDKNLDEKGE